MLRVYRRRTNEKSRWHFDTRCDKWPGPECEFAQSIHVPPGQPLCEKCERLEAELFRRTNESASSRN